MYSDNIINIEPKKKHKKITITIDTDTLNLLEEERELYNIPVSSNLCKAYKEYNNLKKQNEELKNTIEQTQQTKTEIINTRQDLENIKASAERYQRFKQRNYFQRVMSVIFCLDD